jgi:hypothetical protein
MERFRHPLLEFYDEVRRLIPRSLDRSLSVDLRLSVLSKLFFKRRLGRRSVDVSTSNGCYKTLQRELLRVMHMLVDGIWENDG